MVDFGLTEEQVAIQKMVRDFASKEILPKADAIDRTGEFPWDIVKKMGEAGLLAITIPPEYGGIQTDTVSYAIVREEIGKASASVGNIVGPHTGSSAQIAIWGNEEQKEKYLPDLAKGKKLSAMAITEPGAGSDVGGIQSAAEWMGDGYLLNGTKTFVSNGGVADIYVVMARTEKSARTKGLSALIVEKGMSGFSFGRMEDKLGLRASATCELIFEDCLVPKDNLLGTRGEGIRQVLATLNLTRVGVAAMAIGVARAAFDVALRYSRERVQFGQPIGDFQGVQFMLAEMATEIEGARCLVYKAAQMMDQGIRCIKEVSMAKLMATEMVQRVTRDALQVHGGYGVMKDFPLERYLRDAALFTIADGTSQIQKVVIVRQLFKELARSKGGEGG